MKSKPDHSTIRQLFLGWGLRERGSTWPLKFPRQKRTQSVWTSAWIAASAATLPSREACLTAPDIGVGVGVENLLRNELVIVDELGFAPLDDTGAQLLFRFVAAAYERRSLGIASHWPFESWGRFLPEHTTAVSMLDRLLHHCHTVVTDGDSYRMKQARANGGTRLKTS